MKLTENLFSRGFGSLRKFYMGI